MALPQIAVLDIEMGQKFCYGAKSLDWTLKKNQKLYLCKVASSGFACANISFVSLNLSSNWFIYATFKEVILHFI